MTPRDQEALEALRSWVDGVARFGRIIERGTFDDTAVAGLVLRASTMLTDIVDRLDEVLNEVEMERYQSAFAEAGRAADRALGRSRPPAIEYVRKAFRHIFKRGARP